MRARLTGLVLLAILGLAAAPDAAHAQIPGVGPGHCVSASCGGGGGGSSRGGGGRGGGMGGAAGAIGTAIGIGMAIGSAAAQQQQQQQAKEKSGARNKPEGESPRRVSHAREAKPERHKTDQADKPKEAKQPDTKQAKLTQPSKNSNWSGCTGKVGTVWNAGNCGQPSSPSLPSVASTTPVLRRIPPFVEILPRQLTRALPCPIGFVSDETTTFYGGTRCVPVGKTITVDDQSGYGGQGTAEGGPPRPSHPDPVPQPSPLPTIASSAPDYPTPVPTMSPVPDPVVPPTVQPPPAGSGAPTSNSPPSNGQPISVAGLNAPQPAPASNGANPASNGSPAPTQAGSPQPSGQPQSGLAGAQPAGNTPNPAPASSPASGTNAASSPVSGANPASGPAPSLAGNAPALDAPAQPAGALVNQAVAAVRNVADQALAGLATAPAGSGPPAKPPSTTAVAAASPDPEPDPIIAQIAPLITAENAANACGLLVGHVTALAATSRDEHRLIVTRALNPASKIWFADLNVQSKPEQFKFVNTGRSGLVESETGAPLYHNGMLMHGDIDLFLALTNPASKAAPRWRRDTIDPGDDPSFIRNLNRRMREHTGIDKDFVMHADQVTFVTKDFKQLPPKKPDEKYLVTEEDGAIRLVQGEINLRRYLELRGIPWPFAPDGSLEAFQRNEGLRRFYGLR